MKALVFTAVSMIVLSSTVTVAQQASSNVAITTIDSFRGLKWGATIEQIQEKLQGKQYELNGMPIESITIEYQQMFDLPGSIRIQIKNDALVAGFWHSDYVKKREAESIFNALVPKYGQPSRYLVNNGERPFKNPMDAFRRCAESTDYVDVIWNDDVGNELRVALRSNVFGTYTSTAATVHYRSKAFVDEMASNDDH